MGRWGGGEVGRWGGGEVGRWGGGREGRGYIYKSVMIGCDRNVLLVGQGILGRLVACQFDARDQC